jgi:WD40 repeat protein
VATTETVKSGFNQIYTRLGLHDFELGLQMIGYKNGLYDIYADQSKIDVTDNIDLTTLGSPASDLGYISIDNPGGFGTFGSGQYDVSGERAKAQEFTDNHYIEWTGNNSPEVYTKGDHTSVTSLGGGDAGKLYYDGDYLYVGPRTSSVRVYDPDTWSRIETISIPNGPRAEDISASGDYLMVGAFDEYSYVFNKGTWDLETSFYVQYSNMFNVAISDEYAAYATTDANVEVVETGTWNSVTTLGYTDDTTDLRFSPDGSMLSVTGDNYTGIYNTDTWDEDQVVGSGGDLARWGPFSTQLLMDDLDQAEMYDVTTDNLTTTFNDPTNSVNALAWGPSGEYLSFGDLDGTAKVVENTMEVNPGFVEHRAENLDFPPSTVVIGQELRSLPNGTDVEYTISDENGNSLTLGQSDIDKEVDASVLTGTVLETRVDLIPDPSGLKTPELDSWATYFDEA